MTWTSYILVGKCGKFKLDRGSKPRIFGNDRDLFGGAAGQTACDEELALDKGRL